MRRQWMATVVMACVILAIGCGEPLQHGLDEHEANAMVLLLHQQGIDAEKVRDPQNSEQWAVNVPAGQRVEAWTALEQEGFPRPESGGFDDFYPGGGLIPTANEERVILQYATARELQTSLLRIDGIVDAHVHLVLPEQPRVQLSDDDGSEPRASVLVQWSDRGDGPPMDQEAIQNLISGAVEDLRPESVHVVKNPVGVTDRQPVEPSMSQVGPIAVASESARTLKGLVLLMGVVIVALAAGLVYLVIARRRDKQQREAL